VLVYGLGGLALGWVALLVSAPVLPAALSGLTYAAGSFICHQLPERSFHLTGFQLPVCARCLGIYAGGAAGVAFALATARRATARALDASARFSQTTAWALALGGAAPTALTVILETIGLWYPSNTARAVAGAMLGAPIAFAVVNAAVRTAGPPPV
jgi:uncharacterized membrane protein